MYIFLPVTLVDLFCPGWLRRALLANMSLSHPAPSVSGNIPSQIQISSLHGSNNITTILLVVLDLLPIKQPLRSLFLPLLTITIILLLPFHHHHHHHHHHIKLIPILLSHNLLLLLLLFLLLRILNLLPHGLIINVIKKKKRKEKEKKRKRETL